jgi:hypothetical protein
MFARMVLGRKNKLNWRLQWLWMVQFLTTLLLWVLGKPGRVKRSKKDRANSSSLGSVDSQEEFVQEQ